VTRARVQRPGRRRSVFNLVVLASLLATLVPLRPIPVAAPSNYNTTVLGDVPTAYWRLGETAGTTMTDASAKANNGTYAGGSTLGQTGAIVGDTNAAVAFDGASGAASVPNSASLQVTKISIEQWVKKLAETNYGMYVTKTFVANGGARYTYMTGGDIVHGAVEGTMLGLAGGMIATVGGEFPGPVTVGIFGAGVAGGILEPAAEMPVDIVLSWLANKLEGNKCLRQNANLAAAA
jgi:hypothetical protein